mgnify:CR=1 FL=1
MPINVVMPQMGESITEGTIVRWFKEEGQEVAKDEPLLEISTDKVDAEVPSPANGRLARILRKAGDTVPVDEVIAVIAAAGEAEHAPPVPAPAPEKTPATPPAEAAAAPEAAADREAAAVGPPPADSTAAPGEEEVVRRRSSPLARRLAAEHGIDLAQVQGTGIHGRVTKADILAHVEHVASPAAAAGGPPTVTPPATAVLPPPAAPATAASRPARPAARVPGRAPSYATGATMGPSRPFEGDELREPMSIMRQRIAEHMVESRRTSPHVHTVFEMDVSRVVALRERAKEAFLAQHGLRLTYTPFVMAAAVEALKSFPVLNASLEGNEIVYHRHINVGVAVALPHGLIVPVVKRAEELSLVGLQRAITDLADRARSKRLTPDDVHGSTFSITNPGPYGGLFGLPVINQPNVAILNVGHIHRRPTVVTDEDGREALAIRDMAFMALSFDHRLIDGATADQFMALLKAMIEAGNFALS